MALALAACQWQYGGGASRITISFALEVCGVTYDDFGWQQVLSTLPRGAALQYHGRTEIVDLAPAVVAPGAPLVLRLATLLQALLRRLVHRAASPPAAA